MRSAFQTVAALNTATALWLTAMFLVLQHSGYLRNALMGLAIAAFCAMACRTAEADHPRWLASSRLLGSLILGMTGGWQIYQDLRSGADFEGFVLVIGSIWIVQGLLALSDYVGPSLSLTRRVKAQTSTGEAA
jgi:hypothetical protein